ncbi:MAG: DUF2200 family protein, partial [Clostridia bacterium]|nr:DUF2200 family protein [Clostridia bacterium]
MKLSGYFPVNEGLYASYQQILRINSVKNQEKIYKMSFPVVYPYYVEKAKKKGRSKDEVDEIICWLTGYSKK